ncbi:MAG: hypothetical protein R3B82_17910 [Sandaracinaceae bacterium]
MTAPIWSGRLTTAAGLSEEDCASARRAAQHRVFFVRELTLLLKLVGCMTSSDCYGPRPHGL